MFFCVPCAEADPAVNVLKTQSCIMLHHIAWLNQAILQTVKHWFSVRKKTKKKTAKLPGWVGKQDKSEIPPLHSHECCNNHRWNKTLLFWKTVARRTSCCCSFISSPGANFTCASWCLSLCYCFSYIIVPPTCCHSNWRTRRKDRGGKKKSF